MGKKLVVYYSFEGSTKKIAEIIAKSINADIQEIKPQKEFKSSGFTKYIWGGSQVVMGKKPKLVPLNIKFDSYDTIILGTPIWAGTFAPPIKTLLEGEFFTGKKIAYFFTHKGGADKAIERGRLAIEKKNSFISSIDFMNVEKNIEELKVKAELWAKEIEKIESKS